MLALFCTVFLYITFSPNSTPITVAAFPRFLSTAVLPSLPTSNRFSKYAAYPAMNATTLDCADTLALILFSKANFIALTCPSIDCTARSTTPLLPELPTGDSSSIVLQPGSFPRSRTISLAKYLMAGSWSVLIKMSPFISPHSEKNSNTLSDTNLPLLPFSGTTVAIVMPVVLSRPTKMVRW